METLPQKHQRFCSHPKRYFVAPNEREKELMAQLSRPAFRAGLDRLWLAFLPFNGLAENGEALCRFGDDHTVLQKIARS